MSQPTITQLHDPSGCASDPFTYILRDGARKLIEQAIHAELAILMAGFSEEKLADARAAGAPWSPAGSGAADLGGVVEADEKFFRGHFLLRTICGMDKLSDMIDLQYMRAGLDREEVARPRGGEEWIWT